MAALLRQGVCVRAVHTEYCNKLRLTMKERLELFMQLCEGVQHAHQKAILCSSEPICLPQATDNVSETPDQLPSPMVQVEPELSD